MCDFGSQSALKTQTVCSPLYERNVYESTSTCRKLSFYFLNTARNNKSSFSSVFLASDSYKTCCTLVNLNCRVLGCVFYELFPVRLAQAEPVKETEKEA